MRSWNQRGCAALQCRDDCPRSTRATALILNEVTEKWNRWEGGGAHACFERPRTRLPGELADCSRRITTGQIRSGQTNRRLRGSTVQHRQYIPGSVVQTPRRRVDAEGQGSNCS